MTDWGTFIIKKDGTFVEKPRQTLPPFEHPPLMQLYWAVNGGEKMTYEKTKEILESHASWEIQSCSAAFNHPLIHNAARYNSEIADTVLYLVWQCPRLKVLLTNDYNRNYWCQIPIHMLARAESGLRLVIYREWNPKKVTREEWLKTIPEKEWNLRPFLLAFVILALWFIIIY